MLCHLPLLLPLAGLALFAFFPFSVALALYLPLLLVSVLVGRAVVGAMRQPVQTGAEGMRGAEGLVLRAQGRRGVARLHGELWNVVAAEPLAPGTRVVVETIEGLTATVRPAAS